MTEDRSFSFFIHQESSIFCTNFLMNKECSVRIERFRSVHVRFVLYIRKIELDFYDILLTLDILCSTLYIKEE